MINSCNFQAYDLAKKLVLAATPNRENETLSVSELATAGFLSAIPATLITAPVERAKVLLQVSLAPTHLVHLVHV
jgi:solute carrier family 25 carnitine/acylcarnitine transporter 20/29